MTAREWARGDRVWYRPAAPGYGYEREIPAIVDRLTMARVRVVFHVGQLGLGHRVVDVATTANRLRERRAQDAAAIDEVWASLHSAVLRAWDELDV